MNIIRLKNGSEEAESLVVTATVSIRSLLAEDAPYPMAFWDLVAVCKDDTFQPMVVCVEELKRLHLMESNGTIHDSIKNIVLSSLTGEGLDMTLVSPMYLNSP